MVATAESFENGGFVAPGVPATFVYLNLTTGSQDRVLIFAFSEDPTGPDRMKVEMDWLSPTHLEVKYEGQHTIDFQAVKYAGVDISVRGPSPETPKAPR
jgi:hypothetical protein